MAAHLQVARFELLQEARLQISRNNGTRRSHSLAKPPGDRTRACSDFETPPSGSNADRVEAGDRRAVESSLDRSQTLTLVLPGMLEQVAHATSPPLVCCRPQFLASEDLGCS